MVVDGRKLARPVNYALVRIIPPAGVADRRDEAAVHHRGPARGTRAGDRRVQAGLAGRRRPEGRPPRLLRDLLRPAGARARRCRTSARPRRSSSRPWRTGTRTAPSRPLWATARAAGRPCCWPRRTRTSRGRWSSTAPRCPTGAAAGSGGEGENPMRYLGGLMGGAWLALLTSDLGNGLVDGAHFVANFERLNPANTLWSKYYNLFAKVDTEPPRFLEFERWWGGYFLMNEAELRWILDNLFVGNRLARGEAKAAPHTFFDLKAIRSPDHRLLVGRRQHHAAAAGPELDRRRLRQHRGDQGQRPGDRRAAPRGRRAPGDLRVGPGGQEGARPDRRGAEAHRVAAPRPVPDGDPRGQGRRRASPSTR